jgi:hypothetical protein
VSCRVGGEDVLVGCEWAVVDQLQLGILDRGLKEVIIAPSLRIFPSSRVVGDSDFCERPSLYRPC